MSNDTFVNPYTFIQLGDECVRGDHKKGELSGVLHCILETLSPLIIPNAGNEHAFPSIERTVVNNWNYGKPDEEQVNFSEHKSYDFFSYEDPQGDCTDIFARPIIPASSLRGAIRSAYEALTDSCLSTIDEEMPLHKRNPEPYKKYGVIEGGVLYEAEKVLIHTDAVWHSPWPTATRYEKCGTATTPILRTGVELWVTRSGNPFHTSRGFSTGNKWVTSINTPGVGEKGYYLAGEQFGNGQKKHFDAVMVKSNRRIYTLTDDDKRRLLALWQLYQENKSSYSDWINAESMPVYYEAVGKNYYFSPACISQEVFHRRLGDMLGDFKPCSEIKALCEACSLFGTVAGENGALASRISFRDATPVGFSDAHSWYDEPKSLPILGTPHITSTEFYQVDPDLKADYYNADYKVIKKTKVLLSNKEARIRGRKFYWHSEVRLAETRDKPNQNNTFRPVSRNKLFEFKVRFERLTLEELSKLVWVLEIGGNEANAHKLGHGKSVGFGSVRICVDRAKSNIFSVSEQLVITEPDLPSLLPVSDLKLRHYKEFIKVTNYAQQPANVAYPRAILRGEPTTYAWFGLNRQGANKRNNDNERDQNRASIFNTLPNLLDDSQELPVYAPVGGESLSLRYAGNREIDDTQHSRGTNIHRAAAAPDPQGTTIADVMRLQQESKLAKTAPQYRKYTAPDIKLLLTSLKRDPKTMKALRSFVSDFERAESEGDKRYKNLVNLYKLAKEKLDKLPKEKLDKQEKEKLDNV
jgi:CRISPR-associated protein (TIGR03986 family)